MKKLIALILCIITLFSTLTIISSAETIKVQSQNELDYYQMAVGNEYVVYGRMSTCHRDNDVSFVSMVVGGNVSNTYKKAVYSYLYYTSGSYEHLHTLTTKNASSKATIPGLSYDDVVSNKSNANRETYVEMIKPYTSSTRPNITVTASIQASLGSSVYISHPDITSSC